MGCGSPRTMPRPRCAPSSISTHPCRLLRLETGCRWTTPHTSSTSRTSASPGWGGLPRAISVAVLTSSRCSSGVACNWPGLRGWGDASSSSRWRICARRPPTNGSSRTSSPVATRSNGSWRTSPSKAPTSSSPSPLRRSASSGVRLQLAIRWVVPLPAWLRSSARRPGRTGSRPRSPSGRLGRLSTLLRPSCCATPQVSQAQRWRLWLPATPRVRLTSTASSVSKVLAPTTRGHACYLWLGVSPTPR